MTSDQLIRLFELIDIYQIYYFRYHVYPKNN